MSFPICSAEHPSNTSLSDVIDVQFNMYNLLIGIANDAIINSGLLLILTVNSSSWSSLSQNTFWQISFYLRISLGAFLFTQDY